MASANRFLTGCQGDEGTWRDYELEPGPSDAWITACVGHALLRGSSIPRARAAALHRAAQALLAGKRPAGWGYNSRTACDADSTSWALRFLARMRALQDVSATSLLGAYTTSNGGIRTFASPERFGSWAGEHTEVTALAGLALLAAGERRGVDRLRAAVLATWADDQGWHPFWWRTDTYVRAQSLEFLLASGGIPAHVAAAERARLSRSPVPVSSFERALTLAIGVYTGAAQTSELAASLLGMQSADGGWPASAVLLVPDQRDASRHLVYSDKRRALSTAMAIHALRTWLVVDQPKDSAR